MIIRALLAPALMAAVLATACGRPQAADTGRPIVVQGAMQIEVEKIVGRLQDVSVDRVGEWTFWRGFIDGHPVVISKTLKGMSNAAAATTMAAEHYQPSAIVNQGTAGGHDPALRVYDIVIGTSAVNIGAFKSPYRPAGGGSNPMDWKPLNLTASDGSAATDPRARGLASFDADAALLSAARAASHTYSRGKVVEGIIGSSDIWNDEVDRVVGLHEQYGTAVEEMETASAAQIARSFGIPFLGVRIVSDNITNGGAYDPKTADACEDFVHDVVREWGRRAVRGANPQ
ncbi:MAG TPA: 5'-methylthioadenosine/S-adenosylhomocysteine nucleosidase [Vicinamibacterales bacterium]|jgi:adenosylhomocysteine nucleosidase